MLSRLQASYFILIRQEHFRSFVSGEELLHYFSMMYGWDIKDIPYFYKDQVQKAKLFIKFDIGYILFVYFSF